jgi:hypothetical protein
MRPVRIYRLSIDDPEKEFFLFKKLLEENPQTSSSLENHKNMEKVIYVANSSEKTKKLKEFQKDTEYPTLGPCITTVQPLFELFYEKLPLQLRIDKHLISDEYAKIIIRHIIKEYAKNLTPRGDFNLSSETSSFFFEWIKNIKEYNLHLKYESHSIGYREDSDHFTLDGKEQRFNSTLFIALCRIYEHYSQFLDEHQIIDRIDKRWWVIDHLDSKLLRDYSFYIEHLSILRKIEQIFFSKIYKNGQHVSLLDYTYPFSDNHLTSTGIVIGEKEIFPIAAQKKRRSSITVLHRYQKKEHEVEAIAKSIQSRDLNEKITIISPNIDSYEKVFARIFPLYSIHSPLLSKKELAQFPIIKTCMAPFEIITQNFSRRSVVSFLLSPLVKILKKTERRNFDRVTRERLIVSGRDWEKIIESVNDWGTVTDFINRLNILKTQKGLDFLNHYIALLDLTVAVEDENEIRPYNEFIGFLHSLRREPLLHTIENFNIYEFQRIFLSYITSKKIQVEFESARPIEMLSLEETSGMVFERVFLIGLVEGELPRKPQYNPLFSEKLLEEMKFPTYDLLYSLSKFNFESIECSVDEITCSFFEKDERGNIYMGSPFLHDIKKEVKHPHKTSIQTFQEWQIRIGEMIHDGKEIEENLLSEDLKEKAHYIQEGIERLKDDKRLRSIKETLLSNRDFERFVKKRIEDLSSRLSAYSLETYVRCPYSFFFSFILKLRELEDPETGVDASLRGKVIHSILSRYFKRRLETKVRKTIAKEWDMLKTISSDTIEEMAPGTRDKILLKLELVTSNHASPLHKMLKIEELENRDHIVMDVEWVFSRKEVSIECDGERIGISGRIDRIDRYKDSLVLFDYKTGRKRHLPKNKNIKGGKNLQLPLYGLAVQQKLRKVPKTAYYVINNKDGCSIEERESIPNELLISNICKIWEEIKELNFEPKSHGNCSRFCAYSTFCPIH